MARFDIDAVKQAAAEADLPAIARRFTKLAKHGKKWSGLCPFHREKTPSFGLYQAKNGGGWRWRCLGACNEGGDAIAFVMKAEGVDFPRAMETLGAPPVVTAEDRKRLADLEWARADAARADAAFKVEAARQLWKSAVPLAGTTAEKYLEMGRSIPGPFPGSLRFLAEHKHKDDGRSFPTLVGVMADAAGRFKGIHRTYLRADGWAKAEVTKGAAKKMLGELPGSCVRLDPPAEHILLAEGIESALSVRAATGRPTFACLSLSNFNVELPPLVRAVTLCFDSDEKVVLREDGREQAEVTKLAAIAAHQARGLEVLVSRAPKGMDFNDVLQGKGKGL